MSASYGCWITMDSMAGIENEFNLNLASLKHYSTPDVPEFFDKRRLLYLFILLWNYISTINNFSSIIFVA
jgi:hypothetical protein